MGTPNFSEIIDKVEEKWSATFLNESKAISHLLAAATNKAADGRHASGMNCAAGERVGPA